MRSFESWLEVEQGCRLMMSLIGEIGIDNFEYSSTGFEIL